MTPRTLSSAAPVLLAALVPGAAAGQVLPLEREPTALPCAPAALPAAEPSSATRAEVERLTAEATRASIAGDHEEAAALLERAATLDPVSGAVTYRLARTLEALGRREGALAAYCRFLSLSPDEGDAREATRRMDALGHREPLGLSHTAVGAFAAGVAAWDEGRLREAEAAFGRAHEALPSWSAPLYNRGVVRLELGLTDQAAEDFRSFLAMTPGTTGARAVESVLRDIGGMPRGYFPPAAALAAGLIVPGMGQFATGRPATGALVFGAAVGAAAAGLMIERVQVECLAPPRARHCPGGSIHRRSSERPYLVPGLAVGAAVAVLGAVDAYAGARRRAGPGGGGGRMGAREGGSPGRIPTEGGAGAASRVSLLRPGVALGFDAESGAAARVELVRLRF